MNKVFDEKVTAYLAANTGNILRDIDDLLRFQSVTGKPEPGAPLGGAINGALNRALELCAAEGMAVRNIDGVVAEAVYGAGEQSLGILAHMDVVPAGSGWTKEPYALTVEDGMLYGRGVADDKGPAVAALWALKAALAAGARPGKRIVFIFGGDEESGMSCLKRYLQTERAPDMAFSPDAGFPVIHCEKTIAHGALTARLPESSALKGIGGGTRSNVVPDTATALLSTPPRDGLPGVEVSQDGGLWRLTARGHSAHASTPEKGSNAVVALLAALKAVLPAGDPALDIVSGLYACCAANDGSGLGIACADEASGALTLNLGVLSVENGEIVAALDIRHPVTVDVQGTIYGALPRHAAAQGLAAVRLFHSLGLYVPKEHVLVRTLMDIYNEVNGSHDEPVAIGGGTYARMLPCAVAYGMMFPDDPETAHIADERVSLSSLLKAARIYAHAIAELGK